MTLTIGLVAEFLTEMKGPTSNLEVAVTNSVTAQRMRETPKQHFGKVVRHLQALGLPETKSEKIDQRALTILLADLGRTMNLELCTAPYTDRDAWLSWAAEQMQSWHK